MNAVRFDSPTISFWCLNFIFLFLCVLSSFFFFCLDCVELSADVHIDEEALRQLYAPEGIVVDGWRYEPMKVEVKKKSFDACVLRVSITEGKNREIRRVFASIGLKIRKLIRVAYGPYSLEDLLPGDIQEVPVSASLLERAKKSSSLVKSRTSKPKPKRLRRKPVENRLNSQESIKQRRELQNVE